MAALPPGRHDLRLAWNGQDGGASGMMRTREYRIPFWFTPGIELAVPPAPVVRRAREQFGTSPTKGWLPWQALRRKLDREQPDYKA